MKEECRRLRNKKESQREEERGKDVEKQRGENGMKERN